GDCCRCSSVLLCDSTQTSTAASPARAAGSAPAAAAPDPITHQASLHVSQCFELLDRLIGFLLLVPYRPLTFGDLRLQYRCKLLDRRWARIALRDVLEQLQRALIVGRCGANHCIEDTE